MRRLSSLLKVNDLQVSYGAIKALRGISFKVEKGQVVTLIGSNGAGKTTSLHAISNIIEKSGGKIFFNGSEIQNLSSEKIFSKGHIQVPEGRRVFANMTVKKILKWVPIYEKIKKKYAET